MAIGVTEGLKKKLTNETAAIGHGLIVKFGSTKEFGTFATAATDKSIGVSDVRGADPNTVTAAVGAELEIVMDGIPPVRLGGSVSYGDLITSNSAGRGVATTTAGNRYIGVAMSDGVSGDFIPVKISQGLI